MSDSIPGTQAVAGGFAAARAHVLSVPALPAELLALAAMPDWCVRLWLVVRRFQDGGLCTLTVAEIGRRSGKSRSQASTGIAILTATGWLTAPERGALSCTLGTTDEARVEAAVAAKRKTTQKAESVNPVDGKRQQGERSASTRLTLSASGERGERQPGERAPSYSQDSMAHAADPPAHARTRVHAHEGDDGGGSGAGYASPERDPRVLAYAEEAQPRRLYAFDVQHIRSQIPEDAVEEWRAHVGGRILDGYAAGNVRAMVSSFLRNRRRDETEAQRTATSGDGASLPAAKVFGRTLPAPELARVYSDDERRAYADAGVVPESHFGRAGSDGRGRPQWRYAGREVPQPAVSTA